MALSAVTAADIQLVCSGTATQVVNGTDTIFLFNGAPALKTSDGSDVDWYLTTDTLTAAASGVSENYMLNSGDGVAVRRADGWIVRYVFDYRDYIPSLAITDVSPNCLSTDMTLEGTIPELAYTNLYGQKRVLDHEYETRFTSLSWGGDDWTDSLVVMSDLNLHTGVNNLPERMLKDGEITVSIDSLWRAELEMPVLNVVSATVTAKAVASHPTSLTTARGSAQENEALRPTSQTVLDGSAPLEILFESHPSSTNGTFYLWTIYKETNELARRTDENTRFNFVEPGHYRVVNKTTNAYCPCTDSSDPDCAVDSTEFLIAVSESYLHVPQVFTPNGDGMNDEFRVDYQSIAEFDCRVYNRWGKLVYEWTDPAKGWDGTINGRPAPEGAYYYVIRAKGTDADKDAGYISKIAYQKKLKEADATRLLIGIYQLSGDINLLRGK